MQARYKTNVSIEKRMIKNPYIPLSLILTNYFLGEKKE